MALAWWSLSISYALAAFIGTAIWLAGVIPVLVTVLVGVWLFYVQHQFEETS